MPVYVDDAFVPFSYRSKGGMIVKCKMSHLFVIPMDDHDLDVLHRLAASIGLASGWFQGNASYPHYNISMIKRKEAVKRGTLKVTVKEGVKLRLEYKRRKLEYKRRKNA